MMLRPLLLASVFAFAAPAMAQDMNHEMTPSTAQDTTAPEETMDHSTMDHSTMDHSQMGDTTATESTSATTDTMTTATTGATTDDETDVASETTVPTDTTVTTTADADVAADTTLPTATTATTTADAGVTATTSGTYTGMGGPIDVSQWSSFDTVGDGRLSPLEFAGFMAASMGRPVGDMEDQAVELLNENADELAMVDTDGDWHVSQAELTAASPQ